MTSEKHVEPTTAPVEPPEQEGVSGSLKKPKKKGNKPLIIAVAIVLVIAGAAFGMTRAVYSGSPTEELTRKIVSVFPYPAVKINDRTLTISEYLSEYDALVSFFDSFEGEAEQRPSEIELEENIIDTMINKAVIELLAEEYGVVIDQGEVDSLFEELVSSSVDSDSFEQELQETFGWEKEDFRINVVEPIVLATQMSEFVAESVEIQTEKRERVDAAYGRLESGEDFMLVASETNDDRSAIFGGDLGYMLLSDLPVEWLASVEELEIGGYTEVIESADGFAILFLSDRIVAGEDEQVQLNAILVRKRTVEVLVEDYLEEAEVKRYIGQVE